MMQYLESWECQMCRVLTDYGAPLDNENYLPGFELEAYATLLEEYKDWQLFYYENGDVYHLIIDYKGYRFVLDLVEDIFELEENETYRDRAALEAFYIVRRLAKKEAEIDADLPKQLALVI